MLWRFSLLFLGGMFGGMTDLKELQSYYVSTGAPPCLSLREYSSGAACDKVSAKREGGAFAPPHSKHLPRHALVKLRKYTISRYNVHGQTSQHRRRFLLSLHRPRKDMTRFFHRHNSSRIFRPSAAYPQCCPFQTHPP